MTVHLARYRKAASEANPVAAEAALFETIAASLAQTERLRPSSPRRVRALADARRLWLHTATLSADPNNRLPQALRAQIISVAMAVLREIDTDEPDAAWVADITRTVAEGLRDASRRNATGVAEPLAMQSGV